DPILGWSPAEGVRSNWINTGPHGIRMNTGLRQGHQALGLISTPHAVVKELGKRGSDPVFRLSAAGGFGEHYAAVGGIPIEPGRYHAVVFAKAGDGHRLRLQLVDNTPTGLIADVDLAKRQAQSTKVGS